MKDNSEELNRLNIEDYLFIVIIVLALVNIFGDYLQKQYIKTNNKEYLSKSRTIFIITLTVTIIIYLYYVNRNYKLYKNSSNENKNIFSIKLIGSILIVSGVVCLLYFQIEDPKFVGTPII